MNSFELVCWESVLPRIRLALQQDWNVKEPDQCINLLETWQKVLPAWALVHLQTQVVMPKLEQAVEEWNPRSDPVPIHHWLHPWLPSMSLFLRRMFPAIRFKFASCLQSWHPSDPSAHSMLAPWKGAFSDRQMNLLLEQSVLPKLEHDFQAFSINPLRQDVQVFERIFAWRDLLPVQQQVRLLLTFFFPKFQQVLSEWLSTGSANYDELAQWYIEWKAALGPSLTDQPAVREQLHRTLDMMLRSVCADEDYRDVVDQFPSLSCTGRPSHKRNLRTSPTPRFSSTQTRPGPSSMKDLVQQRADAVGILFMPRHGKTHHGKPVYQLGDKSVVFEQGVTFVKKDKGSAFVPESIDSLFS